MSNWTIRRAEPKDAIPLAACIDAAYSTYRERISDLPPVSKGIAEDIETKLVWVAVRDGRVVGGLILLPEQDHIVVMNVAVSPEAAGMGLGRAFLDLAEAQGLARNIGELRLSTHTGIPENVRLYEHLGWHETGRLGNKVHMAKSVQT